MRKSNNKNDGRRASSSRSNRSSTSGEQRSGARGFAAMSPEEHRRISAMGGHASHGGRNRTESSRSSRSRVTASR